MADSKCGRAGLSGGERLPSTFDLSNGSVMTSQNGGSARIASPTPVPPEIDEGSEIVPGDPGGGLVILADHASNRVPEDLHDLGLGADQLRRHIAFDIGVEPLARRLAARFGAPAVLARFSRLVIDPNRGVDDPTLVMRLSDGAVIPGNAEIDESGRQRRIERFWSPYDRAIARTVDACLASGRPPVLFSVHSFTPIWHGCPRPWHCGVLWDADPRLPSLLIERLRGDPALVVGDNEPYDGAVEGGTLHRHGTRRGLAHAILEIRQDLLADADGVAAWADRIAPILEEALAHRDLARQRLHGSRTGPVPTDPA
jgi:predicted N-formylglutamate amidohydrolase